MAVDNSQTTQRPTPMRDTGALVVAFGGLAAAFGAASCCGLPLLLGSVGLGSAWLIGVASIAAPHRLALLLAAVICLGAGGVFIWRRRFAACTAGMSCGRPAAALLVCIVSLGAVLAVLGYFYA